MTIMGRTSSKILGTIQGRLQKKVIIITFEGGGQQGSFITFFHCLKMIFKQF